jgi:hypothetical protein
MYYVFDRDCIGRWIQNMRGDIPGIKWSSWRKGALIQQIVPDPLKFTLQQYNPHSSDDSAHMPSYLRASAPLFDDLIDALRECGVNNIDCYNVDLLDPDNGQIYKNYKAIIIIGLIAAADIDKSNATVHASGSPPLIDVDFDRLTIDNSKTHDVLFFRLAESTNAIIAHEKIKNHLLAKGFDDLAFYEPEKVAL